MAHATSRENQILAAQAKQAAAQRDQKQQEVQQLKVGKAGRGQGASGGLNMVAGVSYICTMGIGG
jgi:hypothetical protein